jgi:chromosomal replication initiation ATPase DnaA
MNMKQFPTLSESGAQQVCEDAVGAVAKRLGITSRTILSKDRSAAVAHARAAAIYDARQAGATSAQIRRCMEIKHLTTVEVAIREEAGRRVMFRSVRATPCP